MALTTAPVRQVTLGMENRAKVHVETFIKKIERLDFDVEVLGFVPSFTGKKKPTLMKRFGWDFQCFKFQ